MANPKPEYINDEWFDAKMAGQNIGTRTPPGRDAMRQAPLEMPGDVSGGAGVRSQGAAEQAKLDHAIGSLTGWRDGIDPVAPSNPALATAPQVYAGSGNYQYEVRGNDIFITGSKGKKLATPIRVDPSTAKGAIAYNAIITELAPEGVTLKPVKVPSSGEDWRTGIDPVARSNPALGERDATEAMPRANQAQADRLREERLAARGVPGALGSGAIASLYEDMEPQRPEFVGGPPQPAPGLPLRGEVDAARNYMFREADAARDYFLGRR